MVCADRPCIRFFPHFTGRLLQLAPELNLMRYAHDAPGLGKAAGLLPDRTIRTCVPQWFDDNSPGWIFWAAWEAGQPAPAGSAGTEQADGGAPGGGESACGEPVQAKRNL